MDFCRVGLTYGSSGVSATLGDVWSDVGKMSCKSLSTSMSRCSGCFHTRRRSEVESFEGIADTVDTRFEIRILSDALLDFLEAMNHG